MSKQYWSRNAAPALAGVVLSLATATAISAPTRWAGSPPAGPEMATTTM
jgi:hypothetical protein